MIERSRAEPELFREIFDRHLDEIYRYLAHRTDAALAEDLTSETFVIAFARRATYVALNESARPWLFGIATNLLRERIRRERRDRLVIARLAGRETRPDREPEMELDARADASGERERIWSALRAIRRQEREALLLYAWADLSYAEIAIALRCPIGTVRSRIARARIALSRTLGEADPCLPVDPPTVEVQRP